MNSIEQEIANSIQAMETGESRYIEGRRIVTQSEIDLADMEAQQALEAEQVNPDVMMEGQAITPQLEGEPQPIPGTEQGPQAFGGVEDQTNVGAIAGSIDNMGVGEFLETTGQVFGGAAGGAATATLGIPGDVIGIVEGIVQAAKADDGQGLDAFLQGMGRVSDQYGSAATTKMLYDFVDGLDITDEAKEQIKAGSALLGEWGEIPGVAVAAKAFINGLQKLSPEAASAASQAAPQVEQIMAAGQEFSRADLPQKPARPESRQAEVDELGFVMKSLEVAKNLQQQKGTAAQFIKRLRQNGVSAEEIDALGLREKFKSNERITRAQLEQTIRDRRIELEESTKGSDLVDGDEFDLSDITFGEGTPDRDSMNWQGRAEDYMYEIKEGDEYAIDRILAQLKQNYPDDYSDEQIESIKQSLLLKEMDQLDARDRSNIDDAAYDAAEAEYMENPYMEYRANETDNYTIYGNDDIGYQILRYGTELVNDQEVYSLSEAQVIARQDAYEQGDLAGVESVTEARFENFMLPGGENYREILLRDPETPTGGSKSHWSEDDVIGHVLVKDRVDAQGNKTLYAEEVQSDFAQSARPSSAEKTRMEMAKSRIAAAQKDVDFANEQIEQMRSQIKSIEESMAGMSAVEKTEAFKKIEAINKEVAPMERRAESNKKDIDYFEKSLADTEADIAARAEKVGKTRFVKDTQQWLRPTLKRLIAKAIEEGYDTVSVPPHQVVHERWNEDYGDFYRKSVPNTLLKVAKQLDPRARLEYSDLVDSAYPDLRTEASNRGLRPGTNGLESTPTIRITPEMRKAYEEKGQSLFVPGAATVVAGKLVVDQMAKDQNND